MQLARVLKRNPRAIAEELAAALRARRRWCATSRSRAPASSTSSSTAAPSPPRLMDAALLDGGGLRGAKVVIEHTNINPNKAAHIGHLRNAVLGDVLGRSLKSLGYPVEIQNYIDDTGVQLADVVVGFLDLRGLTAADVAAIPEPFDYYCWDLYSEVGRWFDGGPRAPGAPPRDAPRDGDRPRRRAPRWAGWWRGGWSRRHLGTMRRIDVSYDLLTRESDILGLELLRAGLRPPEGERRRAPRERGEERRLLGDAAVAGRGVRRPRGPRQGDRPLGRHGDLRRQGHRLPALEVRPARAATSATASGSEEGVWETTRDGVEGHPLFGGAWRVFNVIDVRQSYLQKIVRAGLQAARPHAPRPSARSTSPTRWSPCRRPPPASSASSTRTRGTTRSWRCPAARGSASRRTT